MLTTTVLVLFLCVLCQHARVCVWWPHPVLEPSPSHLLTRGSPTTGQAAVGVPSLAAGQVLLWRTFTAAVKYACSSALQPEPHAATVWSMEDGAAAPLWRNSTAGLRAKSPKAGPFGLIKADARQRQWHSPAHHALCMCGGGHPCVPVCMAAATPASGWCRGVGTDVLRWAMSVQKCGTMHCIADACTLPAAACTCGARWQSTCLPACGSAG
jgi:hypothetical protein